MAPTACARCHKTNTPDKSRRFCGGCFVVFYCSRSCQRADRKDHKKVCGIEEEKVEEDRSPEVVFAEATKRRKAKVLPMRAKENQRAEGTDTGDEADATFGADVAHENNAANEDSASTATVPGEDDSSVIKAVTTNSVQHTVSHLRVSRDLDEDLNNIHDAVQYKLKVFRSDPTPTGEERPPIQMISTSVHAQDLEEFWPATLYNTTYFTETDANGKTVQRSSTEPDPCFQEGSIRVKLTPPTAEFPTGCYQVVRLSPEDVQKLKRRAKQEIAKAEVDLISAKLKMLELEARIATSVEQRNEVTRKVAALMADLQRCYVQYAESLSGA